jgi:hypothetical protein
MHVQPQENNIEYRHQDNVYGQQQLVVNLERNDEDKSNQNETRN